MSDVKADHRQSPNEAVSAIIDSMGFGPFQIMMLFLTGGVMFAEGAEMLVMGSITTLLHDHWELNAFLRGIMVSIVFVGFSVGNLISGAIGDRFGRRKSVLLAYALIGTAGFMTAGAWGPGMMVCIRFFCGVGCGIGFPAVYSLIPEVCPTVLRGSISTLMIGFMPIGELYAAVGVLMIDPNLDENTRGCEVGYYPSRGLVNPDECSWKTLCEYSAIPAFMFLLVSACCLYESPHFLASRGRFDELESVLTTMAKFNRYDLNLEDLRKTYGHVRHHHGTGASNSADHGYSFSDAVSTLMNKDYVRTTFFMFFAHFTKDFSVFGLSYALPQYFSFMKNMIAGTQLCIVASLALPGVIAAFFVTRAQNIGHITSMTVAAGSSTLFILGMLEAAPDSVAAPSAYMVKLLSLAYFIIVVVYTTEVFPTSIRNTAVGCCTCFGRLGSISAPLIFEMSIEHTKSFDVFMYILFVLMAAIAASARLCLTRETKGKALVDVESDVEDAVDYGTMKEGKAEA